MYILKYIVTRRVLHKADFIAENDCFECSFFFYNGCHTKVEELGVCPRINPSIGVGRIVG